MLVISLLSLIVILTIKELLSVGEHTSRIANFLYLPVIPLLVLFGISAYTVIARIPQL